jgi:hypothetical protein
MHTRSIAVIAVLFAACSQACSSEPSKRSVSISYSSGTFGEMDIGTPVATGTRAQLRVDGVVAGFATNGVEISSSNPAIARVEKTLDCSCHPPNPDQPDAPAAGCEEGLVESCFDRFHLVTHAAGDAELFATGPDTADVSVTVRVRDVADSHFTRFDSAVVDDAFQILEPGSIIETLVLEMGDKPAVGIELLGADGTALHSGDGPTWEAADPSLVRVSPLIWGEVPTVSVEGVGIGETTLRATFAGVEHSLPVLVR